MNAPPRDVLKFRTIWLSDIHLGTRGCQAELLVDFLRLTESRYLYLVGDIVDNWRLRRAWYWPQLHNDVIQKLLRKARKGTRVTYVPGNHDDFFRDFCGHRFGHVAILRYVVQHDCGTMVNPAIVEGQVHGGVAQGIGGALYEKLVYDDQGQLLTGTFMDFLLPTAMEVPDVEVGHIETPSPLNPPAGCAFHPRCPYAIAECSRVTPRLEEFRAGAEAACIRMREID